MAEGWIKLHRKILQSDMFYNEKLLKVFVWCLCKASHAKHMQIVGRQSVPLEPGQFVTGRLTAGPELNMPPSTAWDYLKLLERGGTINIKSNNKFSIVTVENWEVYQNDIKNPTTNEQQTNNKWTTNGQQMDTNKNGKNDNNDNNVNNSSSTAANYIEFFNNNFHLISSYETEILNSFEKDGLEPGVIQLALEKAIENGARNMKYVKSILVSWLQKNIKTVEAVQAEQQEFKRSQTKVNASAKVSAFNDYTQRQYDYDDLERKLLGWDKE